ncbi:MAG: hypothetical protein JRJ00_16700, partial [Deltaproteobacteria bacterium]|nr:hypothetical protein [Deltaproteobacteria bacterium]
MEEAVLNRVPKRFIEMNKKAFKEGVKVGKKTLEESKKEPASEEEI